MQAIGVVWLMTTVDEYLYKGKLFCELDKYTDALKSFDRANAISNIDEKWKRVLGYNGKGVALDSLLDYKTALVCFESALAELSHIPENNEDAKDMSELDAGFAMVYHNKGYTLGNDNQYKLALECLDKAISYFKKANDKKKDITRYKIEYADTLRIKAYVMADYA